MQKRSHKVTVILGVLSVLIFLAAVSVLLVKYYPNILTSFGIKDQNKSENTDLQILLDQIALQTKVDEQLLAALESGTYTFENPLIAVDPYGCSPLTALVIFQTEEEVNISIRVPGEDVLSEVAFEFDGFSNNHIIPVYGLYANSTNDVELTATTRGGSRQTIVLPIQTEPLNQQINDLHISVSLKQPQKYAEGFTFRYHMDGVGGRFAFDVNGVPRLFLKDIGVNKQVALFSESSNYLFSCGSQDAYIYEINPLGRIFRILYTQYDIHHDMIKFDGNTILTTGSSYDHDYFIDDLIVEHDFETGEIRNVLDLKDIFQTTRNTSYDPFHLNALVGTPNSTDLLVSLRNQDMVARMSYPEGEIIWIAGTPEDISPMYEEYLLTPIGEDFSFFYHQHAPFILDDQDGNPNTMDIILFDNGLTRDEHEDIDPENLYSRLVQYRIDEKNMTIEQIREYGEDFGAALFSSIRGDANVLSNGNWLGIFDVDVIDEHIVKAPVYIELDENNRVVWMLQMYSFGEHQIMEYRSERMPIYNQAANDLKIGTPASILIPQTVINQQLGKTK